MKVRLTAALLVAALLVAGLMLLGTAQMVAGDASGGLPQGVQSDASFVASYDANHVAAVSATTMRISCYRPEVAVEWRLGPDQGYLDGGLSPCAGAVNTGEDLGP